MCRDLGISCNGAQGIVELLQGAGAAALLTAALLCSGPALADLNKYEQAAGGECVRVPPTHK